MERFIEKLLLYLLIPSVYFGMNALVNYQLLQQSVPNLPTAKVLILGDSHFRRAINPSKFESAINVSLQGEPYMASYWKLKKLLPIVQPDTVFIAFSPYNIGAFNDAKFSKPMWATTMFEWYYPIAEFDRLEGIDINYKAYFNVMLRQFGLYPHRNHINYIGEFVKEDHGINKFNNYKDVIDRQFYDKGLELGISETAVSYLDSLIQLCQKHHVTPILIGTPVYRSYFELIPEKVKIRFDAEKEKRQAQGIKVIDETQNFYPDSCYLDADHLNSKGAQLFMSHLLQQLKD